MNLHIPDEVFEHPLITIMEDAANDTVVLSNVCFVSRSFLMPLADLEGMQDIYSYNIEQAQGDTMNIIETAMREKDLDVQGAIDYAAELVDERVRIFVEAKSRLPSWGPAIDKDVQIYLRVCEDWMTAGFHWRYVRGLSDSDVTS